MIFGCGKLGGLSSFAIIWLNFGGKHFSYICYEK